MFCWHCGAQIPDNAQFCPKCGQSQSHGSAGGTGGNQTGGNRSQTGWNVNQTGGNRNQTGGNTNGGGKRKMLPAVLGVAAAAVAVFAVAMIAWNIHINNESQRFQDNWANRYEDEESPRPSKSADRDDPVVSDREPTGGGRGEKTLLAGELDGDPLVFAVTAGSTYIQNPQDYFGGDMDVLDNDYDDGYTDWKLRGTYEDMNDYVDLLCGGGYNLTLADSYYKSYSGTRISTGGEFCEWLIDYTGGGDVDHTKKATFIEGGKANIVIYGTSERAGGAVTFHLFIPGDMNQVDLGLRHSGGSVSVGAGDGTSAAAGLYRMPDGSFQTTDGRLTAKLGEAAVLRDGKECSAPAEFVRKSETWELWVRNFRGSEMLYLSLPRGVAAGETYTMQDILKSAWWKSSNSMSTVRDAESFGGYRWGLCLGACHGGDYILPTYLDSNQFENIVVRVLHWEEDKEAVFYIYAAFDSSPRELEALCAVDLTDVEDKTGAPAGSGGNGDCWYCGGDGDCPTCGGSGTVRKPLIGTGEYVEQECTDCYSPGKCRICGGSGEA